MDKQIKRYKTYSKLVKSSGHRMQTQTQQETFKTSIIEMLSHFFGDSIRKFIDDNYDNAKPSELIVLARHMLDGYLGEKKSEEIISSLMKKYPEIKL
jgi:hypothetical protein